ncbi:DUF2680 domain-containing protein [Calidifontibacillus erzurumensis]|uniref:DUF2680 domain-containing protein n=1 Tax=Calidifontibacillus erzurumensis TaxID=2741433 RepID=A0A8J8KDF9_9BACI|nr:DUF2680 domain-containing protein [Calidifontibacillus erzurumensis]NSL52973.1 DUF2680 domain-containing protein [Calidifontibacillus erzurumensis]
MKKLSSLFLALFLTMALALPVWAQTDSSQKSGEVKVELTKEQQEELSKLHDEILQKKFEMIDKHVEFGVISKEKGEKIKEKLRQKAEKMKKDGMMKMPYKSKCKCDDDGDQD